METQTASVKKIALTYGMLLALLSIVLQVIAYVLDAHIDRPLVANHAAIGNINWSYRLRN